MLFDQSGNAQGSSLGQTLTLCDAEGKHHDSEIVSSPFYDAEKKIPRGLEVTAI